MNNYITTPIYYASGEPHLGHAYTTFLADCYKRYKCLQGGEAFLLTGTDEHGQKIERLANAANQPAIDFVAQRSQAFRDLWQTLNIDLNRFCRTTDSLHIAAAIKFWSILKDAGDIYQGTYSGLYCVDCEQYFTTGDICPVHKKPLENFTEDCWFFRLSKYQNKLIAHIEANPAFIIPVQRANEVLAFLRDQPLRDLAVSRQSTQWGIPVPEDEGQVLYVWIDALVSYISAIGYGPNEADDFKSLWQNTTHFIGKDILLFHAIYWPALLLSANLALPKHLVVNGWLTIENQKISKSNPDTIINPTELSDIYTVDGLRYYFLRTIGIGADLNFNPAHITETLNADLANNVGNLASRVCGLAEKYLQGHVTQINNQVSQLDVEATLEKYNSAFKQYKLSDALRATIDYSTSINQYLQFTAPWKEVDPDVRQDTLWQACNAIENLAILLSPFTPNIARKLLAALGIVAQPSVKQLFSEQHSFKLSVKVPIFPRIENRSE